MNSGKDKLLLVTGIVILGMVGCEEQQQPLQEPEEIPLPEPQVIPIEYNIDHIAGYKFKRVLPCSNFLS